MNEGFEKTIKLFMLWWFLYLATLVICTILGRVFMSPIIHSLP